jgi:hypothetical protein
MSLTTIGDSDGRELTLTSAGAVPVGLSEPTWITGTIPVLDTSAYAAGDALHVLPLIIFKNALRAPTFKGWVTDLVVEDSTATPQNAAGELWLFDRPAVTLPALNAAWTLVAADRIKLVTVIPFGPYYTSTATGVSIAGDFRKRIWSRVASPNLYGLLVTRGAPTYTASSLKVTITVEG